jgi:Fe-S cluster assembly protein SufD
VASAIEPVTGYGATFARVLSETKKSEPSWLTAVRQRAFDTFQQRGFPTTREEDWRFTSVAPIAQTEFSLPGANGVKVDAAGLDECRLPSAAAELVFVNGHYAPALSRTGVLPRGVRVESLAAALAGDAAGIEPFLARIAAFDVQSFTALNTAFWTDGALIVITQNTILEDPIHLVFLSTGHTSSTSASGNGSRPNIVHPRVLVLAASNSQASIVESYVGASDDRYFTNTVTEASLAEGAIVNHYKLQRESERSYHVATIHAVTASKASFNEHSISFGGELVRNDLLVTLAGEGAESTLNGLYTADRSRLVDNHTTIDHAKPHCDSREIYKGILADRARAVFNGKIIVRPDAQKTDAKQTNKALLLSNDAEINTKPQLEIFANDVKCTHGAAVGQMDEDALFYLQARGLPRAEARSMLIHAFAGDVLNRMPLESIRTRAEAELLDRLSRAGSAA